MWLFGYELPETVLALTTGSLEVVTSKKKAGILSQVAGKLKEELGKALNVHIKDKGSDGRAEVDALLAPVKAAGGPVGIFGKDKHEGTLVATLFEAMGDADKADVTTPVALLLGVKDDAEIKLVRKSAFLSSSVMANFVQKEVEKIVENSKR